MTWTVLTHITAQWPVTTVPGSMAALSSGNALTTKMEGSRFLVRNWISKLTGPLGFAL